MPVCDKNEEKWPSQYKTEDFYKAGAMYKAPSAETHPPPLIPPFLLVQNLSSKQIAPTDNMCPKLLDQYTRHQ